MSDKELLAVAFGGGTNSTAMLCGFKERGIKPDLIVFADTGGEWPDTYEHVKEMDGVCREWWGIGVETVKKLYQGEFEGLERASLRLKSLPSLAYGKKACSMKYKVQPQDKRVFEEMDKRGLKNTTKAIGYDANEAHRKIDLKLKVHPKGRIEKIWYPLIDWGWRREECVEAIKRHGITQPGKSACFFCPAMKRGEILKLKHTNPDLFKRALAIEAGADIRTEGRGLGGKGLRWENVDAEDEQQTKLWDWLDDHDATRAPCGCYDG